MTTPGRRITPGSPGSTVTPGDSVRPVNTGQKAQLEKTDQCLDQSELSVLNSPCRSVQLEHNVHEQPGTMPNLQIEHLSEHFQIFQDFTISDSPDVRADDSTERTHLQDSGLWFKGIGHTVNSLGTGHTGNRSDREHSVRRSGSVRSDAMEHGSDRTRHHSDVSHSSRVDSITHRQSISPRHTDPGELSPASMIRHRRSRSRSSSYDSVFPRRHCRSPSRSRGKKKSHMKRKLSSTSSSSSRHSSSSSSREWERKRHESKRRRRNTLNHVRPIVTSVRRGTRGRGVLLHLLLCLLLFLQTLLLLFREAQPGRSLELILGLLLRLMTILTPLLGLRVRRHTGIISVYLGVIMSNLIRILRIIRI